MASAILNPDGEQPMQQQVSPFYFLFSCSRLCVDSLFGYSHEYCFLRLWRDGKNNNQLKYWGASAACYFCLLLLLFCLFRHSFFLFVLQIYFFGFVVAFQQWFSPSANEHRVVATERAVCDAFGQLLMFMIILTVKCEHRVHWLSNKSQRYAQIFLWKNLVFSKLFCSSICVIAVSVVVLNNISFV